MKIYPAIDIIDGKCVRLTQGRYEDFIVYSNDPLDVALQWERMGAEYIHVVDLDGAKLGSPANIPLISAMAVNLGIPVQLGGGIRGIEQIEIVISKGIQRVILGTTAVSQPEFVKEALKTFQENIVIGIDAKDGNVAIEGWFKATEFKATELAKKMQDRGAKTIIFTDISRDGMLGGPNLNSVEEMIKAVDIEIIVAGGVSSVEDIRNCKNLGAGGAIIGKALYTGDIDLIEALAAAK